MYGEEEEKITIDKKTFKTLASDTRIGILKSLNVRRKTLSELSKEHHMSVSTIKEHLDNLVDAELIVQIDDGHKWKYYELTKKGHAVLNPEERKVWIMLSLSAVAIIAAGLDAVTGVFSRIFSTFGSNAERSTQVFGSGHDIVTAPVPMTEKAADAMVTNGSEMVSGTGSEIWAGAEEGINAATQANAPIPWVHIAIILLFAVLAIYFLFRLLHKKKR